MIRVVLADDHSVVRRGIRDFLTEAGDIVVVAEADNGTQALDLIRQHRPDVAVLDIQMSGSSGIEVARRLRNEGATLGILILTAFDDPPYIRAALEIGANGYVLKISDADEIVGAVRATYEGQQVMDGRLLATDANTYAEGFTINLTEREQEVLQFAAQGLTNKSIGFKLSISDRTVQEHLAHAYEKLSVANRAEAVTKAARLGLLKIL
jgi:DNA-binding NarL/FixJ family response regulator